MGSQGVRRKNDPDFKREVVRVVLENPDKSKAHIARELGIDPKALYAWMQEYRKHDDTAFPGNGKNTDEVAALRRELKLVTQERDILKNAISSGLPSLNGRDEILLY
jgi:transposase-like protein